MKVKKMVWRWGWALGVLLILLSGGRVFGAVEMRLLEIGGKTELERNFSYSVCFQVEPLQVTDISQIYAYVRWNSDYLQNMSLTDRIAQVAPGVTWETNYVNVNYTSDGSLVTTQYLKANQVGENWNPQLQPYEIYRLNFKVRPDAPLSVTNINFTEGTLISDGDGTNVTGSVVDYSATIEPDTTAPVTSVNPAGSYYNTDRNVLMSLNEPGSIYYRVDEDDDPEVYHMYTGPVAITGEGEGSFVEKNLIFYGVDAPYETTRNIENLRTETYYIDKETPSITNFTSIPSKVGMGGVVTVGFEVSDLSGVLGNNGRPNYVRIGDQNMTWLSGSHVGEFEYQWTVWTEAGGTVEVKATDAAGNFNVQSQSGLLEYDLEGPEFIIKASPDPIHLQQVLKIALTANELLRDDRPDEVLMGGEAAGYQRKLADTYYYNYLMTGRDWEANLSHLEINDDYDGDGLPNWWEDYFGLEKHNPGGLHGADGIRSASGWTNMDHYRFYQMTGRLSDPNDPAAGGQAIPLHQGWNLVSYSVTTAWYKDNAPSAALGGVTKERISGNSWGNFFSGARFRDLASNMIAAQTRDPEGEWKVYGRDLPEWTSTLDYISPDQGLWLHMDETDVLILEGPRVFPSSGVYPAIGLNQGWNLAGILPRTRFYVEGKDHNADGPSDLGQDRGYADIPTMLKAAFNLEDSDFNKIAAIQIMYPPPYRVKAYDCNVPARYQTLHFVQPGAGAWIRLKDGQTLTINYQEPE
ncbi:MAG: hypothetical protein P9M08_08790 [Candidatus Erginobacter occultus]|nr:hypothetical protein [Candidatus Erginobacter occultus]